MEPEAPMRELGSSEVNETRASLRLLDAALLASAVEDISLDYTFPTHTMVYEDPLRSETLPKGQFNLPPLRIYAELPVTENPEFYAAFQEDCTIWGMVLMEVQFEDAYPCSWCSLLFKPHTYRFPFVALCYEDLFTDTDTTTTTT
eukprot:Protomagalhaensia_wolfi_Nauph_80__2187@NODE_2410_length_1100_cov_66_927427_g1886_i0_p1_GENE_NODE_2410_length_1100_cov_66_927427_g1886_i0NODE_2410_length_1100_cov_66_927427_g1886_i0_p1_ORF_typecomplete_len145_score28_97_NODE_2410_length_1100_cov_66_927427_g1886_i0349783